MIFDDERIDAIYVRESTVRQAVDGYNMFTQEDRCRNYLKVRIDDDKRLKIKVYREMGHTGTTMKRPVFNQLVADVKAGKIRYVVVQKLDRFGRTLSGIFMLINEFAEYGTGVMMIRENIDTSAPGWRMFVSLFGAMAEEEIYTIRERTDEAFETAALRGSYIKGGKPPFGTIREKELCKDNKFINKLKHHPFEWPILLQIYDMANNGYNCTEISRIISNLPYMIENNKKLNEDTIEKILSNKIYCGIMLLKGKEYKIKFLEPMTLKYWQQVQINRSIHLKRDTKNEYNYHGKVYCDCGTQCTVDVTNKMNASGFKKYLYYECPCCGKRINQEYIIKMIEPKLNKSYKRNTSERIKRLLREKISRAKSLKAELYKLFINGRLKQSIYVEEIERVERSVEEMNKRLNAINQDYDKLKFKDKKLYIESIVKRITVNMDTKHTRLQLI